MRSAYKFWSGNLKRRNQLEEKNDIKMDLIEAWWDVVILTHFSVNRGH
jgi:hypothetical protein